MKQNNNSFNKNRDLVEILYNHLPQKIFVKDRNSIYISCNKNYANDLGVNPDEIAGKTDYDFYPQELAEKYREDDGRILNSGITEDIEESYRVNGELFYVQTTKSPVKNEEGEIVGILGIFHDITERKSAEDARRESDALFRATFDHAAIGIAIVDPDGHPIVSNFALHKLLGYSANELKKMSFVEFTHPDDADKDWKLYEQLINGERDSYQMEKRYIHKDGRLVWGNLTASLVRDVKGVPQFVIGMVEDITEGKELETQFSMINNAIENSLNAFDIVGEDGNFIYVNKAYVELWGYDSANEIIGTSPVTHVADASVVPEIIDNLQEHGSYTFELKARRKDGSLFDVLMSARLDYDSQGKEIYPTTSIDISEHKNSENELRNAKEFAENLIETANVMVVGLDTDGKVSIMNQTAQQITGYSKEDLQGKNWFDVLVPVERFPDLRKDVNRWKESDLPRTNENPILTKDGEVRQIVWRNSEIKEMDEAVGIISFGIDISEQKQAESELEKYRDHLEELIEDRTAELLTSETRFRSLVESMDDVVYSLDNEQRHTGVYGRWIENSGLTEEFFIGKTSAEILGPEAASVHDEANNKALAGERTIYEWSQDTDQGRFHYQTSLSPLLDETGEVDGILGVGRDITDLKQAEDAIRTSEQRFRAVFENSPLGVVVVGAKSNIVEANQAFCSMLGYTLDELLKSSMFALTHPNDLEGASEEIRKTMTESQGVGSQEIRLLNKDGQPVWCNLSSTILLNEQGVPTLGLSVIEDITERKQAADIIHESEERLSLATHGARVGIWDWDVESDKLIWDDVMHELYGITPEDFSGAYESWTKGIHPEDVKRSDEDVQAALRGEADFKTEFRVVWPDGSIRHIRGTAEVHISDEGKPVRMIGVHWDITESKQTEELLKIRMALIEYANTHSLHEILQKTLDEIEAITGSQIGFYHFLEPDQVTISLQAWSSQTEDKFCVAEGQGMHYPVDQAGVWADAVRQKKPVIHNDYSSLPHRKGLPEGHAPVIRELVVPIIRSNRIVAIIGFGNKPADYSDRDVNMVTYLADVAWDIFEQKRSQEALENLAGELSRSNEELEQFAYIASHDLQAPLRKITAFSDRLKGKYHNVLDERGKDYLKRMADAAERGQQMISDLLELSRVTTQGKPFQDTDLNQVVQEVLSDLEMAIEISDGCVEVDDLPIIKADPSQMRQLFQNLIANALKFHKNGIPPKVVLKMEAEADDFVRIIVADNGIGFDEEFSDRIFQPFQRLRSQSEYEGSGIGLSICLKIVERHGGQLSCLSQPGDGSIFTIVLPKTQSRNISSSFDGLNQSGEIHED